MSEQTTVDRGGVLVRTASRTTDAPYSATARIDDLVFTSGALPIEPDGTVSDDFATQVRTALTNLAGFLEEAGANWGSVLKINGYVADIEQLPTMNEVYTEIVCKTAKPARTTVEVSRFRGKTLVEFDAVAVRVGK